MRGRERYETGVAVSCTTLIIIIIIIIIIIMLLTLVTGLFLPGTSLEPTAIPTAQVSRFRLQYFPYYV